MRTFISLKDHFTWHKSPKDVLLYLRKFAYLLKGDLVSGQWDHMVGSMIYFEFKTQGESSSSSKESNMEGMHLLMVPSERAWDLKDIRAMP